MIDLAYALKISARAKPCQEGIFLAYEDRPPEGFGQRLKRLAKAKGYTNRDLARLTGAHEVTVSRWMSGTEPGLDTLLVLTDLLGVTLDQLRKGRTQTPKGPYIKPAATKTPRELEKPKNARRKGNG